MDIVLLFVQGFFTFAAPCHLPLLPVLMALFAGGAEHRARCFFNTLAFTAGITAAFCSMGAAAGAVGAVFSFDTHWFDVICGAVMVVLGVIYTGLLPIHLPHCGWLPQMRRGMGIFACLVFGALFSLSFIPCSGALWGSAMLIAAHTHAPLPGALVMLAYSAGVALPYVFAAMLTDKVKNTVGFVKRHRRALNLAAAALLIVFGLLMATGTLDALLHHEH